METIKKSLLLRQLGAVVNITNLPSPRSSCSVRNQFQILYENGVAFQSYETLIAVKMGGVLYLTDAHDYSKTTSKYATEWTGYNTAERRAGLESGKFVRVVTD